MKGSRRLAPRHQRTVEARQCAVGLEPLCGAPDGLCMRLWSWMNPSAVGTPEWWRGQSRRASWEGEGTEWSHPNREAAGSRAGEVGVTRA